MTQIIALIVGIVFTFIVFTFIVSFLMFGFDITKENLWWSMPLLAWSFIIWVSSFIVLTHHQD